MANAPYTPAQLRKWKRICRSDPERVLRVFHLGPPPAKSPEGDTGGDIFAIMEALQGIAIGQGVPGKPDPAWKDLVEAGITEELCDSVQNLVTAVKPGAPKGVSKERLERAIKEAPSPCFLPFAVLNQGALHFSQPPGPLDKRMLSALKFKWSTMMQSIWENPQNTLLPDSIHGRARRAISQLFVRICFADPTFKLLAYKDLTVPAMTRLWIASADSEGDGMDARLTSMAMRNLLSSLDEPSEEQLKTNHVVPDLKLIIPLVYLGANAQDGATRSSQADAIVEAFIKHFKRVELKSDIRLLLTFLALLLDQNDSDFLSAVSTSEAFWKGLFALLDFLLQAMIEARSTEYAHMTFSIALCLQTLSEVSMKVPRDSAADFILLLIKCDLFELLDTRIEEIVSMDPRLFVCSSLLKLFTVIQNILDDGDPSFKEAIAQQLPRANLVKTLFRWDMTVDGVTEENSPAQQAMAADPLSQSAAATWRLIVKIQVACIGKNGCTKRGCKNVSKARCAKCQIAMYCSPECQKQDWKEHKKACQYLPLMDLLK